MINRDELKPNIDYEQVPSNTKDDNLMQALRTGKSFTPSELYTKAIRSCRTNSELMQVMKDYKISS